MEKNLTNERRRRNGFSAKSAFAFLAGIISLPLVLLALGIFGYLPSKATAPPPRWETMLAGRALDAALQRRAKDVHNPITRGDVPALSAGMKIYVNLCAGCHGGPGKPSNWGSNDLYPRAPQFWEAEVRGLTPEKAYVVLQDGIRYSGMAGFDRMPDRNRWNVANFVATIPKLPKGITYEAEANHASTSKPRP